MHQDIARYTVFSIPTNVEELMIGAVGIWASFSVADLLRNHSSSSLRPQLHCPSVVAIRVASSFVDQLNSNVPTGGRTSLYILEQWHI